MKRKIKTKIKKYLSKMSNTNLVGLIGVLIIFASGVGNNPDINTNLKASILENNSNIDNKIEVLSVGSQIVRIGGKDYEVILKPKY